MPFHLSLIFKAVVYLLLIPKLDGGVSGGKLVYGIP